MVYPKRAAATCSQLRPARTLRLLIIYPALLE
jgi:hypothetical protein